MEKLTDQEMSDVSGGVDWMSAFSGLFGFSTPKTAPPTMIDDEPFIKNMKKMFGASAGRDLAKLAQKYKLVGVVNSIFGW